jgi:cardiolipin synthase
MTNLPNLITMSRILVIPLFVGLMIYGYTGAAFAVFILAGISDALDGIIARTWKLKTQLGTYLDPTADKLLLTSAFLTLSILGFIPVWAAVILVSRDLILAIGVLILDLMLRGSEVAQGGYLPRPTALGKITTTFQLLWVTAILFSAVFRPMESFLSLLLWVTVVLTIVSGFHYVYREIRLLNQPVDCRISPPGP